ncbi:MAG TPA: hypothetical protein ENH88_20195 [Pseudoalteromonas prydzensis]|uniref:Uncharacterized protein n=1 Tax=Pseudoalteromonas prydzensis TaxID=182141 RepID=A0A7V1D2J8_9GAMM|nr:Imm44 family immunity protein [Pseudoalteromonas prydzensis]HEA18724.1 hypothetical protein [Pseudoalteromonas prydzensis]
MDIWIGGEIESTIEDKYRAARSQLENHLSHRLETMSYELELDSLDCIAIIRNDNELEELQSYSKEDRDMDFRLVIDFAEFTAASSKESKKLLLNMLLRAVELLSQNSDVNEREALKLKKDLDLIGIE